MLRESSKYRTSEYADVTALLDTSVLVPALVSALPRYETAAPYLQTAPDGDDDIVVCFQALAELYASLTALPVSPEITPGQARRLIQENVVRRAHEIVPLGHEDYLEARQRVTDFALTSGAVYDALHVIAAEKVEAHELITFNADDFRRMPPEAPTDLVVL